MSLQALTLYCHRCRVDTGHLQRTTSHLFHFLVGLFTVGLWWIVWLLLIASTSSAPRCSRCGVAHGRSR